jgi:alpha-amylase/alpha-mannosidase (GH57 family)
MECEPSAMKYLCVHAHFYQPPRENPWLEQVELQDSAYPYHDWNDRISAECYAPNLAARILDDQQRIVRIVNNYSKVSFNFGPTLLSWAAEHAPTLYNGLIESDKQSQKNFSGHGSAMAQAYNHMILPLANSRDKKTQIRWGIEDFVSRFGRLPEGMWLPETAVDLESLSLMAEAGLSFAILAPHQAKAVRALKGNMPWQDVTGSKIDPSRAYLCNTPSGRSINLFFYDGPISQAVAFEKLLDNGEKFARRLTGAFSDSRTWPQLMHIATDGETYGHHHRHGEMALAYSLDYIESKKLARITNYGEFLEHNPPECEVQIYENTAWSCVHGVERWRSNCGCNSGRLGWHQEWRQPLRGALDWLRDAVNPQFEALGAKYLKDPWIARDAYISVVLDRSPETRARFGEEHFRRKLTASEQVEVWKLMELQRHAMLMYTSCGWFFDDLSGIETVQVIQYAGRVVQLAEQLFKMPFEGTFLEKLALAKSNLVEYGDGASIYERYVKPSIIDLEKVGAHYSISSLFSPYGEGADIFSYSVKRLDYHTAEAGKLRMALGNARFTSKVTQESEVLTFWVVHFGDHNVAGGVQSAEEGGGYQDLLDRIRDSFERVDIPEVVRLLDKRFGKTYSLRSLFRDEQRRIVKYILSTTVAEAEAAYLQLYDHHAALMRFITRLGTPMPREFTAAIDYGINSMLRRACSNGELDGERIGAYLREALASNVMLDKTTLEFSLRQKIEALAVRFASDPSSIEKLDGLRSGLKIARQMPFIVDVWSAQNHVYAIQGGLYERMRRRALRGDSKAKVWLDAYLQLSELLMIRVQNS